MRGVWGLRSASVALAGSIALGFSVTAGAGSASAEPLPLPPGDIVRGTVFKQPGQCPPNFVPQIENGADANAYICGSPPTLSFVPGAPAAMVVTSEPTQYVRVYCPECTPPSAPNRSFMAEPSVIRGLTPDEIRDVLALPATPSMITIVTVPVGTCVLVAEGAAIEGWGRGGTAQAYAAGTPSGPHCAGLQFLPEEDYINRQSIGALALVYGPRAGGGNAGAVAAALDQGPYALPFTDMDLIYKKLDLLNFGDPAPLRAALVQLDGEIYADVSSVAIGASQLYLGALREQMRRERPMTGPMQQWLTGFGSTLDLSGSGDSHDLDSRIGGLAGGFEYRFSPGLVTGVAYGWAYSHFSTSGISGTGDLNTVAVTPYVRYAPGAWYVEGAVGGAWNDASVSRTIVFPGVARLADGSPEGAAFLSQAETGYRFDLGPRIRATPFASLQGVVFGQDSFTETGAGAINLHVQDESVNSAYGVLGTELAYALPAVFAAPLVISGRVGWAQEFGDTERTASAFFDGTPSAATFTVTGAAVPGNAVVFGAGLALAAPGFDLFARYDGATGDDASVHGGSAGLRFVF
jgi:outer membrane autotransporter protein